MPIFNSKEVWEFVKLIVVSLLIIIPIRLYIAQPFIVRGSSMDTTFENGDYLIIDEVSYQFEKPHRGEVIVFRYPHDPSKYFIKRVIGLPGETIEIKDGVVTVKNDAYPEGFKLEENYIQGETLPGSYKQLGDKEYFVMGDNRPFSSDSRYWGSLDENYIIGRALVRLWPIEELEFWPGLSISNSK